MPAKTKTKSQLSQDGSRKLASGAGRAKQKSGGEAQQDNAAPRGSGRRSGSSKQRKG